MEKVNGIYMHRAGRTNSHHILAKKRGGEKVEENLINMDENRHAAFHLLFNTRTLREAAQVLLRAADMKERRNGKDGRRRNTRAK